jgi:hypothetical protein
MLVDSVPLSPTHSSGRAPRRAMIGSEMPCLRQTSATFIPASCSRRTPMICSSVNRLRFIHPSPLRVADSTQIWRNFRAQASSTSGHPDL